MATETVEEPFDDDEFVPGPDYDFNAVYDEDGHKMTKEEIRQKAKEYGAEVVNFSSPEEFFEVMDYYSELYGFNELDELEAAERQQLDFLDELYGEDDYAET